MDKEGFLRINPESIELGVYDIMDCQIKTLLNALKMSRSIDLAKLNKADKEEIGKTSGVIFIIANSLTTVLTQILDINEI